MTERIVQAAQERDKRHQMVMAKNIGKLSTKGAQKRQAALLCRSLIKMIKGGGR